MYNSQFRRTPRGFVFVAVLLVLNCGGPGEPAGVGEPGSDVDAGSGDGGPGGENPPSCVGTDCFSNHGALLSPEVEDTRRFGEQVAMDDDLLVISDWNSVDVFRRQGGGWVWEAALDSEDVSGDGFGESLAVHDGIIAVGAHLRDGCGVEDGIDCNSSGAVHIFERVDGVWSQQVLLKASNVSQDAYFGSSVSLHRGRLLVGAIIEQGGCTPDLLEDNESCAGEGAAYVFEKTEGIWAEVAYLRPSRLVDTFGTAVAIWGDVAVVTAVYDYGCEQGVDPEEGSSSCLEAGAAYVYRRQADGHWAHDARIKASNAAAWSHFGSSVAAGENLIVVGSHREGGCDSGTHGDPQNQGCGAAANSGGGAGAAYVYRFSGGAWSETAYLKPGHVRAFVNGNFGSSLSLHENRLMVGAVLHDGCDPNNEHEGVTFACVKSGAAYLFEFGGLGWHQLAYLKHPSPQTEDYLGRSVAVGPYGIAAGVPYDDACEVGLDDGDCENSGTVLIWDY